LNISSNISLSTYSNFSLLYSHFICKGSILVVWCSRCLLYLDVLSFLRFGEFYSIIPLNRFSVPVVCISSTSNILRFGLFIIFQNLWNLWSCLLSFFFLIAVQMQYLLHLVINPWHSLFCLIKSISDDLYCVLYLLYWVIHF
jgi:hypothetical protein